MDLLNITKEKAQLIYDKILKRFTGLANFIKSSEQMARDYGEKINVRGWVRSRRGNKNVSFIALNDGSTINSIQIGFLCGIVCGADEFAIVAIVFDGSVDVLVLY